MKKKIFKLNKILKIKNKYFILNSLLIFLGILIIIFTSMIAPPDKIEKPIILEIEKGSNLEEIGELLHENKVIRSPFWFRFFVIISQNEHTIPAGDYYFNEPEAVYRVAERVSKGKFGLEPVRVTIIEGWDVFRIANYLDEKLESFDRNKFLSITNEGYLAPDTYFFSPMTSTEKVVEKMEENFKNRIEKIKKEIETERSKDEIIIMASLLEAEANTIESKRKVSDILWKRLDADIPLQVDATFLYINNKNTYQLTLSDLKIDDPYNTYKYSGLPPTPINNPSANAIKAAMDPIENPYWYFLSDLAGNMYYAEDFDGHQYNRKNYLRQ